jgi:hypothetical protein
MKYLLLLMLAACHDSYRYPCQDPDNWGKKICEPPACESSGTCTKDVVTKEIYDKLKKKP